jgi:hypothetical protein
MEQRNNLANCGNSSFGIELEFFLLKDDLEPAFDSGYSILSAWNKGGFKGPVCHELASFQIEINPGPWPLNRDGVTAAVRELDDIVSNLRKIVGAHGLVLDASAFVPQISKADLENSSFFTQESCYLASANYFADRVALLEWEDGRTLQIYGDRLVGCVNEIHIHVQQRTDSETLEFFNFLNKAGSQTCACFQGPITVNGRRLARHCTTTKLFEEANGEWNRDGTVRRVGYLPFAVNSFQEYESILRSFEPVAEVSVIDPFRAVYFWVRLRGKPGQVRLELRPMEMCERWQERVYYLADLALAFQQSN